MNLGLPSMPCMSALTERDRIAHLLRRFGLVASEAEMDFYGRLGWKGAIDALVDYEKTPVNFDVQPDLFANPQGVVNIRVMQGYWYLRLLATQRPLEEKMTIFWHNHFATSADKVDSSYAMDAHIDTLRKNATGKFGDLLMAVSKDPAMLYWLDNQENVAGRPNENFAREVMELFTLGIGHYTEKDIQEAARAFTGWTYGPPRFARLANRTARSPRRYEEFVLVRDRHDYGEKEVLGKAGRLEGEDIIDLLCAQAQTAKFIVHKMWEWFAYADPEPALVDKLAKKFAESDLDIKALIRAIMNSDEFYSEKAYRRILKNPIEFTVSIARQLGAGATAMQRLEAGKANPVVGQNGLNVALIRAMAPAFSARQSTKSMGMELMYPPDVSGWRTGAYWITSATMIERIKWADELFMGGTIGPRPGEPLAGNGAQRRGMGIGYNAFQLFVQDPSPAGAVKKLQSVFDGQFDAKSTATMVEAAKKASGGQVTPRNAGEVARLVCRVMFASPEFQFN